MKSQLFQITGNLQIITFALLFVTIILLTLAYEHLLRSLIAIFLVSGIV